MEPVLMRRVAHPARRDSRQSGPCRTAVLVLADADRRAGVSRELRRLRWRVLEAEGGAGLLARLEQEPCSAAILESWLPDLEIGECLRELHAAHPDLDVVTQEGASLTGEPLRGHCRGELLHALRLALKEEQEAHPASELARGSDLHAPAWSHSGTDSRQEPACSRSAEIGPAAVEKQPAADTRRAHPAGGSGLVSEGVDSRDAQPGGEIPMVARISPERAMSVESRPDLALDSMLESLPNPVHDSPASLVQEQIPELIGRSAALVELRRRIGLVARRRTPVLIHGQTGTGKELVARALHRLSGRPAGRFVAINCAAIPEALVESELFGHARGAYTGAVNARAGRIEAAAGGTIFLDEIGELPLAAQSKLLRFLEAGELQRVGETETIRVEARVVAATHRRLGAMAAEGTFRLDLLHRLAVFLVETPALAGRAEDIDALIEKRLHALCVEDGEGGTGAKRLDAEAHRKLHEHTWPGNVRELEHTLERAWILAEASPVIDAACIDFGSALA